MSGRHGWGCWLFGAACPGILFGVALCVLQPGVFLLGFGDPIVLRLESHAAHQVYDAAQDATYGERNPADGEAALAFADSIFQGAFVHAVPSTYLVEQWNQTPH